MCYALDRPHTLNRRRDDVIPSTGGRNREADNDSGAGSGPDSGLQRSARARHQVARRPLPPGEAHQRRLAQGRGDEARLEDPLSRLRKSLAALGASNREIGVYTAIALLVPGGSLIA